jgi:hypothetical protein
MGTIRCHYCKRVAYLVVPATGVQVCSSCTDALVREDWMELAQRQLRNYPEEWVNDVAAFIQMSVERHTEGLEHLVPTTTCDGCDGSVCGEVHSWRQVLRRVTAVAQNPKERRRS